MEDLPTIPLDKLSNGIKGKTDINKAVKEWLSENLVKNPPEYYVKAAVSALMCENLI